MSLIKLTLLGMAFSTIFLSCQNSSSPESNISGFTLSTNALRGVVIKNPDKETYLNGDTVSLTVVANDGYTFFNWNGDTNSTEMALKIVMNRNMQVRANFSGTVTDIEGNVYTTITIGNQEWMAENLRTTKYNDGTAIPLVTDDSLAFWSKNPWYCYYNNTTNSDSIKKFGALYNWYTVDPLNPKKVAPSGWHVPSNSEWIILSEYMALNGYNWDGTMESSNKSAKALASKTDWNFYYLEGTVGFDLTTNNLSGFTGLPAGFRYNRFMGIGTDGVWWSSTSKDGGMAYLLGLRYTRDGFGGGGNLSKNRGYSVRAVKD